MTEPVRLARQSRVADWQDLLAIGPLFVRVDDDLLDVVRRSAEQPSTRTIGVLDDDGRLIGMVRVLRLAESMVARVAPEALMADLQDAEAVGRFADAVVDRIVSDVMEPPAAISPEASVSEAFRVMHRHEVTGLYVVDREGRPTGYIDLLELATGLAQALEDERPTEDQTGERPNRGTRTTEDPTKGASASRPPDT